MRSVLLLLLVVVGSGGIAYVVYVVVFLLLPTHLLFCCLSIHAYVCISVIHMHCTSSSYYALFHPSHVLPGCSIVSQHLTIFPLLLCGSLCLPLCFMWLTNEVYISRIVIVVIVIIIWWLYSRMWTRTEVVKINTLYAMKIGGLLTQVSHQIPQNSYFPIPLNDENMQTKRK